MEEIRKAIESVIEKVKARGGAIICYVDADGNGKNCRLFSEGKMGNLAILIGAAVMSDDDCRDYILKGVEAAKVAMANKKKRKNVEAEC